MKSKKLYTIGFDLDGVVIDHAWLKTHLLKERGIHLKPEQIASDVLKRILPKPILADIQFCLYHDPAFSRLSPLMHGAMRGLKRIKEAGIPLVLVSRRKEPQFAVALLKKHGLWPEYFNERNAFFVLNAEAKNLAAAALNITHFVDDEPDVLKELTAVKQKFLFDPYNAFPNDKSYVRIASWPALINYLEV